MPNTTFRAIACATFALPLLAACSGDVLEDPTGTTTRTSPGTSATTTTTATTPASGALRWSRTYGGTFDDTAQSLALTESAHARFVAHGLLDGSSDPGEMRALVMDVDGDGGLTTHVRLGSSSIYPIRSSHLAVGRSDQHIVVGAFDHATSLAGCAINGPTGFGGQVIAALDDQGTCLWATTFAASATFSSLDVSPTGEILVAGVGTPEASLGSGVTLPKPEQGGARFHARFSPTGTPLSALHVEGFEMPIARLDDEGSVILSAQASLARVDAQGATLWAQEIPESQQIAALLVTGATGVAAVREETQVSIRGFATSNGVETWNVPITGNISDLGALALGVSEGAGVVIAARLPAGKTISVGSTPISATGKDNLVWALLDATGALVRSKVVPVDGSVYPSSAATDAEGDVWVLGIFTGSVDFGDGLHAAAAPPPPTGSPLDVTGYDVFLVRYH